MSPGETPHYSGGNYDLEVDSAYGVIEITGNAYRQDHDLQCHAKASKTKLRIEHDGKMIVPHVVEPSLGLDPRGIIEIPWPYLKIGPFKIPCAGGPFLRFLGGHFIYQGLRQSMSTGSSFMYFHPLDIARETFPASFSSKRPFYWIIKGKVVENRLRNILSKLEDVEYVTMG